MEANGGHTPPLDLGLTGNGFEFKVDFEVDSVLDHRTHGCGKRSR
jgi:hypothetical protein